MRAVGSLRLDLALHRYPLLLGLLGGGRVDRRADLRRLGFLLGAGRHALLRVRLDAGARLLFVTGRVRVAVRLGRGLEGWRSGFGDRRDGDGDFGSGSIGASLANLGPGFLALEFLERIWLRTALWGGSKEERTAFASASSF